MNFAERIKKIRSEHDLSQEQMAQTLGVSRQAVSNWENNRNLPDIEMIILMARKFNLSLDQLILGSENTMAEKLIRDGSDARKLQLNYRCIAGGTMALILGAACLVIKGLSVEYIDAQGMLHENFFLLPTSFIFLLCGFIAFLVAGINAIENVVRRSRSRLSWIISSVVSLTVVALGFLVFALIHSSASS